MNEVPRTKDLDTRLEQAERYLGLSHQLCRFLTKPFTLGESLARIVSLVAEHTGGDSCLLYLLSDQELILCASSGAPQAVTDISLALEEGLTGWVARERRVLAISREAYLDPRFKLFQDLPQDAFEAFLSAPVLARQRVAGVINVQHRHPHMHTGDEIEMLTAAGEIIGALVALTAVEPVLAGHTDFASLARMPAGAA